MWKIYFRPLLLGGFLSLFCLRYFSIGFAIPFVIAGIIGFYFLYVEGIVNVFLRQRVRQEQRQLLTLLRKGDIFQLVQLIEKQIPQQSMIRSWLFVLVYIVMGIFVMTSTRSVFGEGIILGLGLQYLFDFLRYRKKTTYLLNVYGPMEEELLRKVPMIFSAVFIIFTLLGLRLL